MSVTVRTKSADTYEATGLIKVNFAGSADIFDSSSNPDGVVVVVVRAGGQLQRILSGGEYGAATLIIE